MGSNHLRASVEGQETKHENEESLRAQSCRVGPQVLELPLLAESPVTRANNDTGFIRERKKVCQICETKNSNQAGGRITLNYRLRRKFPLPGG